jgi:hypothetical protein
VVLGFVRLSVKLIIQRVAHKKCKESAILGTIPKTDNDESGRNLILMATGINRSYGNRILESEARGARHKGEDYQRQKPIPSMKEAEYHGLTHEVWYDVPSLWG